jgi:hypothetical protein
MSAANADVAVMPANAAAARIFKAEAFITIALCPSQKSHFMG